MRDFYFNPFSNGDCFLIILSSSIVLVPLNRATRYDWNDRWKHVVPHPFSPTGSQNPCVTPSSNSPHSNG